MAPSLWRHFFYECHKQKLKLCHHRPQAKLKLCHHSKVFVARGVTRLSQTSTRLGKVSEVHKLPASVQSLGKLIQVYKFPACGQRLVRSANA